MGNPSFLAKKIEFLTRLRLEKEQEFKKEVVWCPWSQKHCSRFINLLFSFDLLCIFCKQNRCSSSHNHIRSPVHQVTHPPFCSKAQSPCLYLFLVGFGRNPFSLPIGRLSPVTCLAYLESLCWKVSFVIYWSNFSPSYEASELDKYQYSTRNQPLSQQRMNWGPGH